MSVVAMIQRTAHLRFVSRKRARTLWQMYSRQGWRTREPLDDELVTEQPELLRRRLELVVEEGVVSPQEFLLDDPLGSGEIHNLLGLPAGYSQTRAPDVKLWSPVISRRIATRDGPGERAAGNTSAPPRVIPFPRCPGAGSG